MLAHVDAVEARLLTAYRHVHEGAVALLRSRPASRHRVGDKVPERHEIELQVTFPLSAGPADRAATNCCVNNLALFDCRVNQPAPGRDPGTRAGRPRAVAFTARALSSVWQVARTVLNLESIV